MPMTREYLLSKDMDSRFDVSVRLAPSSCLFPVVFVVKSFRRVVSCA
jgi:hypothetical protein